MKRLGLLMVSLLLITVAFADNPQKVRNAKFSDLPTISQEFIQKYLPQLKVEYIEVEGTYKAEVEFTDGTEVDFGRDGYFKSIENDRGLTMDHLQMLPDVLRVNLEQNFKQFRIEKVEQRDLFYKVELEGPNDKEYEARFTLNGEFLY